MAPQVPAKEKWWKRLLRPVLGNDDFSRRHTLGFRIEEAKKELRKRNAYMTTQPATQPAGEPSWTVEQVDIDEHLKTADAALHNTNGRGNLETSLRHVMAAERKLIAFLPDERAAGAITDLRRDILAYVPVESQAKLEEALEKAVTALNANQPWQDALLEAKALVDEILIRGYQMREQLRDGIKILGVLLGCILVILLVIIPFVLRIELLNGADMAGKRALWIGALFGGIGACLSGLMNFTVHRMARGEYEPFVATAIRPLIGSTSGILAAVLVASGLLSFNQAQLPGLAIAAFLLGFSERLVLGTVERLSTRAEA